MTHNNNFNPLPWYTSLDQQNHRKSYAYGSIYPLYTMANFMLPWQVQINASGIHYLSLSVYKEDGTLYQSVDPNDIDRDIVYVNTTNYAYAICIPAFPLVSNQPDGRYYAVMTIEPEDDNNRIILYSEVYTVVQSMDNFLKIEWYDLNPLIYAGGQICYSDKFSYRNYVYLPTELGKPEYTFEEAGEDRDGLYYAEKQLSEKTYRFNFLAPEYLLDAMRIIRLSDFITITDQWGVAYYADKFLMTPKWTQNGDLAEVAVEFQTNTVIKKIGQGYVMGSNANFNADYNNDYLINNQNS